MRRVYLKATEGTSFRDPDFVALLRSAQRSGMKCGAYHFAHAYGVAPLDEAKAFLAVVARKQLELAPCLDLEYKAGHPALATWAASWFGHVEGKLRVRGLLYSYASYLEACHFAPAQARPLWLAAYGRDDGREHSFHVPHPWQRLAAHQFSSRGHVPGIRGPVDLSRVIVPSQVDARRIAQ